MCTAWTRRLLNLTAAGLGLGAWAETALPVPNAGFEDGLNGWVDTSRPPMCAVLPAAARSGAGGLRVSDDDRAAGSSLRSGPVPARAGAAYALRVWGRTASGGGMGLYLDFHDAAGKTLTTPAAGNQNVLSLPDGSAWTQQTLVGRAPAGTAAATVWLHSANAAVVSADLDDLSLSELSEEEAKTVQTSVPRPPVDFQTPSPERRAELAAWLSPTPRGLGDPCARRERWDELATRPAAAGILKAANAYLDTPPPELPDELYLDFSRTGNRDNYQKPYGQRTNRINALVVAECLENQGRFLPAIARDILALCDERSWTMPAHDSGLSNFKGTGLTIDLGSSARAWLLATSDWLLGERLAPAVRARLRAETARRVLDVYTKAVRSGQTSGNWWMRTTNNWNAVCTAGVVGTALALVESPADRAEYLAAMEISNPFFISGFTDDGYCSEGLGYWDYGFGHYMMLGALVAQATDGRLDLFAGDPKLVRIAAFPVNLALQPGVAPAFADCGINPRPSAPALALIHRYLPAAVPTPVACEPLGGAIHTGLFGFTAAALAEPDTASVPAALPLRTWFDRAGILISRSAAAAPLPFAGAFKGGHNAEHHNHNDVGSFVIALDGHTYLLDPGGEVYTRRTFSGERYVSKVLNSYGHPVPVVAGKLQRTGAQARGEVLDTAFTDAADRLELSLKSCYDVPDLLELVRTFENRRDDGTMHIDDRVRFATPQSFATAVVTLDRVHRRAADTFVIYDQRRAVEVTVTAEGGEWSYALEEIDNPGKPTPKRLGFSFAAPVSSARLHLTVRPAVLSADLPGIYSDPVSGADFQPLPDQAIAVEAEAFSGQAGGEIAVTDKPGASGGKGFKFWDKPGHRLEWTFAVPADGRYAIQVRACHALTTDVTRQIQLDGQPVGDPAAACVFPNTGGWSTDADNWRDLYLVQQGKPVVLELRAGSRVLALVADRPGGLNLDWLRLVPLR